MKNIERFFQFHQYPYRRNFGISVYSVECVYKHVLNENEHEGKIIFLYGFNAYPDRLYWHNPRNS